MPVTSNVQQLKKQPSLGKSSRKGKKAWRKNVDVEDVEGGLEEKRDQERFL
jgi:nucleolar protein 53